MKKVFFLTLAALIAFFGFSFAEEGVAKMKKAVMIIAQDGFRDEELFEPKEVLEKAGIEVKLASIVLSEAKGKLGGKAKPDMLLSDIEAADFDAVIFVGGPGASQYWDDLTAHKLAREAVLAGKVTAAICIAPVTLAKAGVLKGKRATVWSSEGEQLKAAGADYTAKPVEQDGNIITAAGPFAAREFGQAIAEALKAE
ncbi:DJ-1/PfpI family protein [Candidatus Omnitrophota bacterium]